MVQVIALGTFVLLVTTFVSHTVGAIILTPMVVSVGKVRGTLGLGWLRETRK
jgi:di/tricarboxylate transporter